LQARCHIDRIAHDGELKTPGVPDNATEDLADMHPNPDRHRGIELPLRIPAGNEIIERAGTCQCPGCGHFTLYGPVLDLGLERQLRAAAPLSIRTADRMITTELQGTMNGYAWSQTGFKKPVQVRKGERVAITMRNTSMKAHPMSLHGHRFQVIAIEGVQLAGAVRDTVLVPLGNSVTVAFDADNAGTFTFHCHHFYHMGAGMMGFITYDSVAG
jgi:FtsP/CotA-like multicopper oxidase with cupredoxin domain